MRPIFKLINPINFYKNQQEDIKLLIKSFNREKTADLFIVAELVNRIEDYLTKVKSNYENLVKMKREKEGKMKQQSEEIVTTKIDLGGQLQVIKETSHETETSKSNSETENSKEKVSQKNYFQRRFWVNKSKIFYIIF